MNLLNMEAKLAASKIYSILDEINSGNTINQSDYLGAHPFVQLDQNFPQSKLEEITIVLCQKLSDMTDMNIKTRSMELQIWWNQHKQWYEKRKTYLQNKK